MQQLFAILRDLRLPPDGLFDQISTYLVRTEFNKGDYLLRHGEISNRVYFIESGRLRAFFLDRAHAEVTVWSRKTLDFAFLVGTFCKQAPSLQNLMAEEDTVVWSITFEQLEQLFKEFPALQFHARVIVERYFVGDMA